MTLNTQMTMAEAFHQSAECRSNQLAMIDGEVQVTYAELLERTRRLAWGLHDLGLTKGDKVAAFLPPGVDFACLFFALAEIGGVFIPLDPQARPYSMSQVLRDAHPTLVVLEQWVESLSFLDANVKHIIVAHPEDRSRLSLSDLTSRGKPASLTAGDVSPEDLLTLLYTSGTTNAPKGTMHSHRTLIAPVVASLKVRELWLHRPTLKTIGQTAKALARYKKRLLRAAGRPQVFLSTVGWHSITGVELMLQGLLMGDQIVVMHRFHPRLAMQLVQQHKVTILIAMPTAYQAMLSLADFDQYDTSSVLICGTGAMPCPPELARHIQQRFGCALHIGFGATETAGGIAIPSIADSSELQATTVGRPLPGMQVKIVDEERRDLPSGQVGELIVRGDSIMLGYYGHPEATSAVIDSDGWYATGDLATLDEGGYLHIVGRKRDVIIRSGQNIYPAEIEAYLNSHPAIQEAAVVGIPSRVSGEEVCAFVILKANVEVTVQEVLDYCRKELEAYKIPNQVRFVPDFPRTDNGKPQKFKLQSGMLAEPGKGK